MNAITRAPAAIDPTATQPVRTNTRKEGCEASDDQFRKLEEDRVFEARVQWFLAVSRSA